MIRLDYIQVEQDKLNFDGVHPFPYKLCLIHEFLLPKIQKKRSLIAVFLTLQRCCFILIFIDKGLCTNHVDRTWGIFDPPPPPFVDTFTK